MHNLYSLATALTHLEGGWVERAAPGETGPTMYGVYSTWAREKGFPDIARAVEQKKLSRVQAASYLTSIYAMRELKLTHEDAAQNPGVSYLLFSSHMKGVFSTKGGDNCDWFEALWQAANKAGYKNLGPSKIVKFSDRAAFARRMLAIGDEDVFKLLSNAYVVAYTAQLKRGLVRGHRNRALWDAAIAGALMLGTATPSNIETVAANVMHLSVPA